MLSDRVALLRRLPATGCWLQGAHTHKPVAAGAIYYEPDDADDFDDEDPDDDLDI